MMRTAFRPLSIMIVGTLATLITGVVCIAKDDAMNAPLIDQLPFDRVTLNEANDNAVIDVQLLDLPERKVPNPLPETGSLELRRLVDPTALYVVSWSDIAKVELYEDLVLAETNNLLATDQLDQAYLNLQFLRNNYPSIPGLPELTEVYLNRDAVAAFTDKRYEDALVVLSSLYDLNPQRQGLAQAIEGVTDQLISELLAKRDFRTAREMIDSLGTQFKELNLNNIAGWKRKFASGAERQLAAARQAIADGNLSLARQSIQRALAILPDLDGARELYAEIEKVEPQIVVGVSEPFIADAATELPEWPVERSGRLVNPRFVEIVAVGPEGAEYRSNWAQIKTDISGLQLEITLNKPAIAAGITPDKIALQLLRMAKPGSDVFHIDFANFFSKVEIIDGERVILYLRSLHVKPITFLRFPLSRLDISPHGYKTTPSDEPGALKFVTRKTGEPSPAIIEQTFAHDDEAFRALDRGDVDVLDDVAPWQVEKVEQLRDVTVAKYRMPTLHLLLCNYENSLMKRREYRRALCYGIDRPRMVADVFGAKDQQSVFRVLSGPLPAGVTFNDPIGFAYKQELSPLPYEPRLAMVLATAARTTDAKEQLIASGEKASGISVQDLKLEEPEPLILLHPAKPVARTMCQLIKRQLEAIGLPVKLKQVGDGDADDWDIKYTELCLWEPLADVRSLLGPGGLAGRCSPAMNQWLNQLDQATHWNEVTAGLHQIHQLAFEEMPVIPLWQTQNYFAYREELSGIGQSPVSLYQDVSNWQLSFDARGSAP
jgi:tetratricopeptide (TPR) repeat protein